MIILSTAGKPQVGIEYDLYYLKKDLQDWPGYNGLTYALGTKEFFNLYADDRIKRRGNSWNSFEEDGCWTYGAHSSLVYTGIDKKNLKVSIEVVDVRKGASADVYINGVEIGDIEDIGTYCFDILEDMVDSCLTVMEFRINNFGAIGEDERNQGIKIKEIVIRDATISKR